MAGPPYYTTNPIKFRQLILGESRQNYCHQMSNFKAIMHQNRFRLGSLPGIRGPTSKRMGRVQGREGVERGERGKERSKGREGDRREKKWRKG